MPSPYDAILIVSFGGPEGPDEVMPFLENVVRGRNVPRERLEAVAEHYYHFDGISPINAQNRALIAALEIELANHGLDLPVYFGNRNWRPFLADTLRQIKQDDKQNVLAFFTSAYSSYSGCRQYRENIQAAQAEVGAGAPKVDRIRMFYNHPGFIEPTIELLGEGLSKIEPARRASAKVLFTAHSIPMVMADGCDYAAQLAETARLVAQGVGHRNYKLVYQSRSGPASQPWLEPDVCEEIRRLREEEQITDLVIAPIGFISDHLEVLYDLDVEAHDLCAELGIRMIRVPTVGIHPRFIAMIRELIVERMTAASDKPALGDRGPVHDVCPANCCRYEPRRPAPVEQNRTEQKPAS